MGCEFTYTNLQIASTGNAMTEKWNRLHRKLGERDALRQVNTPTETMRFRYHVILNTYIRFTILPLLLYYR
jgi:hypothetical protein